MVRRLGLVCFISIGDATFVCEGNSGAMTLKSSTKAGEPKDGIGEPEDGTAMSPKNTEVRNFCSFSKKNDILGLTPYFEGTQWGHNFDLIFSMLFEI